MASFMLILEFVAVAPLRLWRVTHRVCSSLIQSRRKEGLTNVQARQTLSAALRSASAMAPALDDD